jgi:excisionase family DNA binding protein
MVTDTLGGSDDSFIRAVNVLYEQESARLNAAWLGIDVLFAAYLRHLSRFGVFTYGPITIDVNLIEEIVERTVQRRGPQESGEISVGDDVVRFSHLAAEELRKSGHRKLDELHYLLAFMRLSEGLPKRVFGELGVTPEQVEEFTRTQAMPQRSLEKLYSPEEAAEYLNVHVQTVRSWIRSGRLRARRLTGQRALRITANDLASVLEPLESEVMEGAEE